METGAPADVHWQAEQYRSDRKAFDKKAADYTRQVGRATLVFQQLIRRCTVCFMRARSSSSSSSSSPSPLTSETRRLDGMCGQHLSRVMHHSNLKPRVSTGSFTGSSETLKVPSPFSLVPAVQRDFEFRTGQGSERRPIVILHPRRPYQKEVCCHSMASVVDSVKHEVKEIKHEADSEAHQVHLSSR